MKRPVQLMQCLCGEMFLQGRANQKYCRPEHRPYAGGSKAKTASRGYGPSHQKARKAALRALVPGSPCPRCGDGLWPDQELHLDHTDDREGYLGLSHAHCNLSAGAVKGNRMRGRKKPDDAAA